MSFAFEGRRDDQILLFLSILTFKFLKFSKCFRSFAFNQGQLKAFLHPLFQKSCIIYRYWQGAAIVKEKFRNFLLDFR